LNFILRWHASPEACRVPPLQRGHVGRMLDAVTKMIGIGLRILQAFD